MRDIQNNPKITAQNAEEHEVHKWVAEASEIGLPPGHWPEVLNTDLGNGQPFLARSIDWTPDGDLAGVRYIQGNGCITLLIIND